MKPEEIAVELFIALAGHLRVEPRPPMGDSFEEWLFWHIPAAEHYRSSRQGVARMEIPADRPLFDLVLWQSLLEHPDLVVEREEICLGVECKSLAASAQFVESGNGVPCRTTVDFNSTVPCGRERYKGKFARYVPLKRTAGSPLLRFCVVWRGGRREPRAFSAVGRWGLYQP